MAGCLLGALLALSTAWADTTELEDEELDIASSSRPLGAPPLLVVYLLLAALGVRIAMNRTAPEAD